MGCLKLQKKKNHISLYSLFWKPQHDFNMGFAFFFFFLRKKIQLVCYKPFSSWGCQLQEPEARNLNLLLRTGSLRWVTDSAVSETTNEAWSPEVKATTGRQKCSVLFFCSGKRLYMALKKWTLFPEKALLLMLQTHTSNVTDLMFRSVASACYRFRYTKSEYVI